MSPTILRFDYHYRPDTSNLPPIARASFDAAREVFRAKGLAVQFRRDDGLLDEWCFPTPEARDAFIASLGKPYAISGN